MSDVINGSIYDNVNSIANDSQANPILSMCGDTELNMTSATNLTCATDSGRKGSIGIVVFLVLISISIIVANSVVVIAVFQEHLLQDTKYMFVTSLSISDMSVGVFSLYNVIILLTRSTNYYTCLFYMVTIVFASNMSVGNMLGLSGDMYITIVYPLYYHQMVTPSRAKGAVAAVLVYSFALTSLYVMYGLEQNPANMARFPKCTVPYTFTFIAMLFSNIFTFHIPLVILVFLYSHLFKVAHSHTVKMRQGNAESQHPPGSNTIKSELKTVFTVVVVIGIFFVCWGPFYTVALYTKYFPETYSFKVQINLAYFGMLNSFANTLIYAWKMKPLRNAIKKTFRWTPNWIGPMM